LLDDARRGDIADEDDSYVLASDMICTFPGDCICIQYYACNTLFYIRIKRY
jgi:hypothetical protein